MALSLSNFLTPMLALVLFALSVHAATVTYDFNIAWTTANPDGAFERSVMGINGKWPPPVMNANKGDTVVVHVHNGLKNITTSLHFHGIFQNGTTHMDGAAGVTQCAIAPGSSLTYNFTVDQPGTYWYHSHVKGQYPDGLRAPFIIHDPDVPFKNLYDEEIILTFSDWYHDLMAPLLKFFISYANPSGAEPVPNSALMNDTQGLQIKVQPGKTYLFRMVNMAAFAAQHVWFEGHTMRIVEVDGVYTDPTEADMIYLTAAQRYSVLITTKNDTSANFPIMGSMDEDLFDVVPDGLNPNVTSWLVYDDKKEMPAGKAVDAWNDFDDFTLVPQDKMNKLPTPDHTVELTVSMQNLKDGANYAMFNDETYVVPKVPTIYSAMSLGESATNPAVYGVNTNAFMLEKGQVVDIILNNNDPGKHPFHLHGHNFQVIYRSEEEAGAYAHNISEDSFPKIPMRRDVILVRPNGNFIIRFVADNPGIWLFHCHLEWHTASGLVATLVEAPLEMQKTIKIPDDHYEVCKAANVATEGNAAGNKANPLDLTGANVSPPRLPAGFTARGIVALVFSCIAAFLGCAVISWYGMMPLKS